MFLEIFSRLRGTLQYAFGVLPSPTNLPDISSAEAGDRLANPVGQQFAPINGQAVEFTNGQVCICPSDGESKAIANCHQAIVVGDVDLTLGGDYDLSQGGDLVIT